jgi:hypothetical protein
MPPRATASRNPRSTKLGAGVEARIRAGMGWEAAAGGVDDSGAADPGVRLRLCSWLPV